MSNIITVDGIEYGLVTKLDDLPRLHVPTGAPVMDDDGESWTQPTSPAILVSKLTGRCLVRDSEEREEHSEWGDLDVGEQLKAATMEVEELRAALDQSRKLYDSRTKTVGELIQKLKTVTAERDTLTARVAELEQPYRDLLGVFAAAGVCEPIEGFVERPGDVRTCVKDLIAGLREQQTLGEPLMLGDPIPVGTLIPSNTLHYSVNDDGELNLRCHEKSFEVRKQHEGRKFWCPWVDPEVSLPSPVPEVPELLWQVRVLNEPIGWQSMWFDDEEDAKAFMGTCDESQRAVAKPFLVTPAALNGEGESQ